MNMNPYVYAIYLQYTVLSSIFTETRYIFEPIKLHICSFFLIWPSERARILFSFPQHCIMMWQLLYDDFHNSTFTHNQFRMSNKHNGMRLCFTFTSCLWQTAIPLTRHQSHSNAITYLRWILIIAQDSTSSLMSVCIRVRVCARAWPTVVRESGFVVCLCVDVLIYAFGVKSEG